MNIERKNVDEVSAVLTLNINKADYSERVEKALKSIRQRANIPGFRQGKAPQSMVDKMYRGNVTADEINKFIQESLDNYMKENKISQICEPMLSEGQGNIDFENNDNFTLSFDIALRPDCKINLKDLKVAKYEIEVDDNMVNDAVKNYTARYGNYNEAEVAVAEDVVKGNVKENKENGISVENAVLSPRFLKNEDAKKMFVGAKKGTVVTFSPKVAMENEAEIASFLKIKKEEVAGIADEFTFEVTSITHYTEAEFNQELFDKALGEGVVKSEAEFKDKIKSELTETLVADSDYRFQIDLKAAAADAVKGIKFPEAFFKRAIKANQENLDEAKFEENWAAELEEFKWMLVKDSILADKKVEIKQEDLVNFAKKVTKAQFAQYGMVSLPDEVLNNYSNEMLKDQNQVRQIVENVREEKFVEVAKAEVKLENKKVSMEQFRALFEAK